MSSPKKIKSQTNKNNERVKTSTRCNRKNK